MTHSKEKPQPKWPWLALMLLHSLQLLHKCDQIIRRQGRRLNAKHLQSVKTKLKASGPVPYQLAVQLFPIPFLHSQYRPCQRLPSFFFTRFMESFDLHWAIH